MSRAGDLYERLVAGGITSGLMIIALQSSVCAPRKSSGDDELPSTLW
jgi:hypothetical protein